MKAHDIVEQILRAAEIFPVRDFVQEELDCRKWTRTDLAERMGCVVAVVNAMLDDPEYSLTPEICEQLGTAFGVSPKFWFNLDLSYWLWKLSGRGHKVRKGIKGDQT